jgi:hypothetical protein
MYDLRAASNGETVRVILESGEVFEAMLTGYQHDPSDDYVKGFVSANLEGGLWEQVKDRVDSEVLKVRQDYSRKAGRITETDLYGTVWPEPAETSEPEYKSLGDVKTIEQVDA